VRLPLEPDLRIATGAICGDFAIIRFWHNDIPSLRGFFSATIFDYL